MKSLFFARLRHLILGPGKHRRKRKPEPPRITPDQFSLMFSCQIGQGKYYPQKNGVSREVRFW